MITKIRSRLASESGFTLIELLVVIVIIGILVAIAVPSYLSFRGRAETASAESNVRSAVPAAEDYYQNQTPNSYAGITGAGLVALTPGLSSTLTAGPNATNDAYCLQDTTGSSTYHYEGGNVSGAGVATVTTGACPAGYTMG